MVAQPSTVGLEPKGGRGEVVEADSQRKRMWVLVGNFEKNPSEFLPSYCFVGMD